MGYGDIIAQKTVVFGINSRSEMRNFHEVKLSEISRRTSAIYLNTTVFCAIMIALHNSSFLLLRNHNLLIFFIPAVLLLFILFLPLLAFPWNFTVTLPSR